MSTKKQMVINYVPGEECRVAIVEAGKLEEFHAERMDGPSSHVGNIYVGKVVNVEPAIQAAFIDFGLEQNGFLHISDVHPQYFPGEDNESTERVGKKTPRRDRPPIQECFRRGDEVAVQVLKEGVGTKGPTVTSYLSIPGRFLVMMPQMDRVGVSRKVEDEEQRRKMREILDQLDLPDGFGFILRTAGMERTKAELKRDLAYLQRLWKDMEKRWRSGSKARLLYSESDLLVRALRDMLTSDIEEVVVDNQAALNRAARFLKIVAPRTTTGIVHFTGKAPIFHVLGIEPQIQMIHAREVPLESGGRLVIDEAEALVAIDVNSGKSRDARDAETNAYRTNMEACDEICRQLRLRDIGGVIVNDLIDMRHARHRAEVEARFRENLKKDRARWTIAPISEFGILEMTRQRMRGSHESQHFADCPTCRGRGLVQRPDSVATDGLRELAALLDAPRVHRVEMVVHPRIAGELLSHQRRALTRMERVTSKHVDVRVSDAIAVDRLTFYAYDDRGADIDLATLARPEPRTEEFQQYAIEHDGAENWAEEPPAPEPAEPEPAEPAMDDELHPIEIEPDGPVEESRAQGDDGHRHGPREQVPEDGEGGPRRRRRRRGGRGRGRGGQPSAPGQFESSPHDARWADQSDADNPAMPESGDSGVLEAGAPLEARPENGGEYGGGFVEADAQGSYDGSNEPYPQQGAGEFQTPGGPEGAGGGRRRRRRRGRRGRGGGGGGGGPGFGSGHGAQHDAPAQGQFAQGYQDQPDGFTPNQAADDHGGYPQQGELAGAPAGDYSQGDSGGYAQDQDPGGASGFAGSAPPGSEGQFSPDDAPRRGRRRRGRRGRGGRGGGAGGGETGQGHQPGFDGSLNGHPGSEPSANYAEQGHAEGSHAGYAEGQESGSPVEPEHAALGPGNAPGGEGWGGEDGGGGRRRRRRRGRGGRGRGGGGEGGGDHGSRDMSHDRGQPHPHGQPHQRGQGQHPQRSGAGQHQGRGPGDAHGPRSTQHGHGGQAGGSKPAPNAPSGTGGSRPRTLYSSRRRLGPGDIKGIKREE